MIVVRKANMDMTGEIDIMTESEKRAMQKAVEDRRKSKRFTVTDSDGQKFKFDNRLKALRFAKRIGSTDITMYDPDQVDEYIYDPATKCFVYP